MNVLAISCYPDDMEIFCAGTLLKCLKRGDKVTVCHVCNGSMGHMVIMPEELQQIRIQEAKNSCALAGFEVITCDISDLMVYDSEKSPAGQNCGCDPKGGSRFYYHTGPQRLYARP